MLNFPSQAENKIPTVLIIGGNSRLARSFINLNHDGIEPKIVVREFRKPVIGSNIIIAPDYASLDPKIFYGCQSVINFTGGPKSPSIINFNAALNNAKLAKSAGVRHYIQISSLSVYGNINYIDNSTSETPSTDYGISKLKADIEILNLQSHLFKVSILRLPIIYGFEYNDKVRNLANLLYKIGWFPIIEPTSYRSVLNSSNAAVAILHMIQNELTGIHFAADHELFNVNLLANIIERVKQRKIKITYMPTEVISLIRIFKPHLIASLYDSSIIMPEICFTSKLVLPVTLVNGLEKIVCELR